MRSPYPTAPAQTQQAPAPGRPGRNSRPIDRGVEMISRGVVTPSLFCAARMQAARIIPGRGFQRHGRAAHVRRCA
jgi:hypothetical protein